MVDALQYNNYILLQQLKITVHQWTWYRTLGFYISKIKFHT
jgi:hypothetical protein